MTLVSFLFSMMMSCRFVILLSNTGPFAAGIDHRSQEYGEVMGTG